MSDALRNAVNTKETNQNRKVSPTVPILNPSAEKTVKFGVEPIQDRQELTRQAQPKKNEETLKLPNEKWMESQQTVQSQPQPAQINKIKRDIIKVPPPNLVKKNPSMPKGKTGANRNVWMGLVAVFLVGATAIAYFTFDFSFPAKNLESKPVINTPSNLPNTFKNSIGMEFVKIPSGTFVMGSPTNEWQRDKSESPQREVSVGYEFYLGKFEVIQEEYQKIMGTNPSTFKDCPRCPVENVNWSDAKEFIAKLNAKNDGYEYRLPNEAEWEHAARAGTVTPFSIGDGNNLSSDLANFDGRNPFRDAPKGRYLERTTTVGSYPPNPFGLYDMNGNVWEWCEDIYQENYNGLSTDGSANLSLGNANARILRGGSWINIGNGLRSAVRLGLPPANRLSYNGFRVAVIIK
ncbi:MAG: formylglycine-generating enzyme family protein [Blastocatellia bacterium]|nr:formylglycine-generating enzyme family protein [Blastocatellia bacterium]